MNLAQMSSARRDELRAALPGVVQSLKTSHAADVNDTLIDDYVRLDWLEWHGGSLRLTDTGRNVCRQSAMVPASGA